jgi:hypothetical protein
MRGREILRMRDMDVLDWILLAGAVYIAATSLVILMRRRRDEVLAELDAQAKIQREQKRLAEMAEKKRQRGSRAA